MASVTLKNVKKSFGKNEILKGIDLHIRDGEFMVLLGPSGCGKSTLLRIIAGLEKVTSGEVYIGDRVVNQLSPGERDIAMVFQNYALYPHLTVKENLEFGLKVRKVPKDEIERKVKEVSEMLGLTELLNRYPRELSGGQRQRVAMGRAIVRRPKVFLFDEPLSNLDPSLRATVRVELSKLHQELKTTMIYVTHDQIEAMTLADRIAVMNDGVLQQVGSPDTLYNNPKNLFVARFIGSPSMNFIKGDMVEEGGELYFRAKGIKLKLIKGRVKLKDRREVILGVRPHDFELIEEGRQNENILKLSIEVIEPIGWEYLLHCSIEGESIVVELPSALGRRFKINDNIEVYISPEKIYLFDKKSGESILKSEVD